MNEATAEVFFTGLDDEDTEKDMARLTENTKAAKEKAEELEKKRTILYKVAKARGLTEIVRSIGDHIKDVSSDYTVAPPC